MVGWVGIDWDRLGNVSLDRWGWVRLGELVGFEGWLGWDRSGWVGLG